METKSSKSLKFKGAETERVAVVNSSNSSVFEELFSSIKLKPSTKAEAMFVAVVATTTPEAPMLEVEKMEGREVELEAVSKKSKSRKDEEDFELDKGPWVVAGVKEETAAEVEETAVGTAKSSKSLEVVDLSFPVCMV